MSDDSGEVEVTDRREYAVDDDPLDIKPPQHQAGSKRKERSSKHSSDRKRKHRHRESRRSSHREHGDGERRKSRHERDGRREHKSSLRPASVVEQVDRRGGHSRYRQPADEPQRSHWEMVEEPTVRDRYGRKRRHLASGVDYESVPTRRDRRVDVQPCSEGEMRRERFLQAMRVSEYQKEISRRELEARRQRREMERQRDEELRQIEEKRQRGHSSSSSQRKRSRRKDRDEPAPEEEMSVADVEEEQAAEVSDQNEDASSSDDNAEEQEAEEQEESDNSSSSSSDEDEYEEEEEDAGDEQEEQVGDAEADKEEYDDLAALSASRRRRNRNSHSPQSVSPVALGHESRTPSPIEAPSSPAVPESDHFVISPVAPSPPPSPEQERLPPYYPAIQGCRNVEEFNCLNRIEEGTYGVVYRAVDKRTKEIVALKRLKMENEKEGFPITSLREINTLLKAQHENIVTVREIVVGSNMDKIYIVMDYVEHDLKSLMQTMKEKKQSFVTGEVKCLMLQMLRAVRHLHDNWILHRDLKTSNLLLSHKGILKVGDFGLAREYGSPLKNYTPIVVTLWYRAPELLLGTKMYACPIDLWSVGCIFGELVRMEPMFPGKSEIDQINRIFKDLGTPNEKIWPGYGELPAVKKMSFADYPYNQLANKLATSLTEKGLGLMNKLLTYDPKRRATADDALSHPYFDEQPRPIDPSMFPTWPAKSEVSHRKSGSSPKPPSGRKNLGDEDVRFQLGAAATAGGFSLKF